MKVKVTEINLGSALVAVTDQSANQRIAFAALA